MKREPASQVWQPPGWSPSGAVAFLHGLLAGRDALVYWVQSQPDVRWAEWLSRQGLAPYSWRQLRAAGLAEKLPAGLAQALRGAYYRAVADAELRDAELAQVLVWLREADVTPILFKGAALAYTVYPDRACRQMGDLDLWVTAEAMPRARRALAAHAYREQRNAERPEALQERIRGEVQLAGSRPGQGSVELHWGTFAGEWPRQTARVDDGELAARARPIRAAGCDAWALSPEDALLQLAVHLAVGHQMAYPGVRGLLDVALLVRAELLDWDIVVERARAWRVKTCVWLVLQLTAELLGLPQATPALAALAPSRRRQVALGRFVDAQHILKGCDMTRKPQRLLFQLLLVDRLQDAVRLIARTLWPETDWLQARYGRTGLLTRGKHLLGAIRGRL